MKYASVRRMPENRRARSFRRGLRETPTAEEMLLLNALRDRGENVQFQVSISTSESFTGFYVVDLCLPLRHLFVEVDGAPHVSEVARWRDRLRDEAILKVRPGYRIRRVWNSEVRADPSGLAARLVCG